MTDLSRMRISDADRSEVIEILQKATVEGRLDLDELEDRVSSALAARTWSDVDPLIEDLPVDAEPEPDEEDDDEEPAARTNALSIGAAATLVFGGAGALGSFQLPPWGALIGFLAAAFGAVLLAGKQELGRWERRAVLVGIVLGLLPSVFFLGLLVMLEL